MGDMYWFRIYNVLLNFNELLFRFASKPSIQYNTEETSTSAAQWRDYFVEER